MLILKWTKNTYGVPAGRVKTNRFATDHTRGQESRQSNLKLTHQEERGCVHAREHPTHRIVISPMSTL